MLKIKIDFKSFSNVVLSVLMIILVFFDYWLSRFRKNLVLYLFNGKGKNQTIYTNIKSYHSTRNKIKYFDRIEEIIDNVEDNCIFLIDEVSKRYTKDSKQDLKFYSWLQQSRKHKRYVYLITQEYIQVPTWLRGIANKVYTTSKVPILPLFMTSLGFPVLNDNYEWDIDTFAIIFYKRTKKYLLCMILLNQLIHYSLHPL